VIDAEVYFHQLLVRDIAALDLEDDVAIAPTIDIDQMEDFPSILFEYSGDGQSANGPGLWGFTLTLSVFADGMDPAKALTRALYDVVRAWDADPASTVLAVDGERIWISSADDVDLFSRIASAQIAGRNVTQYVGSFALALRS
jgi:hypothetical protein